MDEGRGKLRGGYVGGGGLVETWGWGLSILERGHRRRGAEGLEQGDKGGEWGRLVTWAEGSMGYVLCYPTTSCTFPLSCTAYTLLVDLLWT